MKRLVPLITMAALFTPLAHAADPPEVKEGLWSIHTQSVDNPGNKKTEGTYRLCRDHAFDKAVQARARTVKGCTIVGEVGQGATYTVETHCTVSGSVGESKTVSTFQGDTAIHAESHGSYNPPLYGVSETSMIMDQKYLGACPAGVQPGDRLNADGSVMHLPRK